MIYTHRHITATTVLPSNGGKKSLPEHTQDVTTAGTSTSPPSPRPAPRRTVNSPSPSDNDHRRGITSRRVTRARRVAAASAIRRQPGDFPSFSNRQGSPDGILRPAWYHISRHAGTPPYHHRQNITAASRRHFQPPRLRVSHAPITRTDHHQPQRYRFAWQPSLARRPGITGSAPSFLPPPPVVPRGADMRRGCRPRRTPARPLYSRPSVMRQPQRDARKRTANVGAGPGSQAMSGSHHTAQRRRQHT